MEITSFFNPKDPTHIMAWQQLQKEGNWPKDFIPKGTEFGGDWRYHLYNKMAVCWIEYVTTHLKGGYKTEAEIDNEVIDAYADKGLVAAVKKHRELTNSSLKDAVEYTKIITAHNL